MCSSDLVLNFSVLDGWWYEGYRKDAGWALTDKRTYQNEQYQNQLDAEAIYYLLDHDFCRGCPADGYLFADGF